MLPLPYHKMVAGMLKNKAMPKRAAKPRKNAIKPSHAPAAKKKKSKYLIQINVDAGKWNNVATFAIKEEAFDFARFCALNDKYDRPYRVMEK